MNYKKLISHIHSKDWYRQGSAVKPLYISYPYEACSHFTVNGKLITPYYFGYAGFHDHDFMNYYFTSQSARSVCNFYINNQKKQPAFLQKLKRSWERKHFYPVWSLCDKLNSADLSTFQDKELVQKLKSFSKIYETAWQESIFLDGFDIHSESIANKIAIKYNPNITAKQLQILTSPRERTWVQKAEIELLKLLNEKQKLNEKLGKYAQKWHWLQNDYSHIEKLGKLYFIKKLQTLKNNKRQLAKERHILRQFELNKKSIADISKKNKIKPQDLNILNGLAALAVWRDSRKSLNQIASYTVKLFAAEIARRIKLPLSDMEQLLYRELIEAIKSPAQAKKLIHSRKNGILMTDYPDRKIKTLPVKSEQHKIRKLLDSLISKQGLKGSPAYAGLIKGKVKIIFSQKDFYKMKKGDILVAPNTRPEYVPIMKLAGAIISEEGGITCHSAIVSRELKIPCIVGVQGATDTLTDKDLVEVDANRGIIKKI